MVLEAGWSVDLIAVAVLMALLAGLALWGRLSLAATWMTVMVRFLIPLTFFAFWRKEAWTLIDDVTYFQQGFTLLARGLNPISALTSRDGLGWLVVDSGGLHILYGWYNLLAQWLLGPHYYAPVLLNVALTFWAARKLFDMAMLVQPDRRYAGAVCAFFLLHWDVIAWSSFMNLKDTLVLALTTMLALAYMQIGTHTRRSLVSIIVLSFLFLWLRFYVPVVMALCFLVSSALGDRHRLRTRLRHMALGGVALLGLAVVLGPGVVQLAWSRLDLSLPSIVTGVTRIILTPQPWSVSENNGFLLLPSILHLAFLPAAVAGFVLLWREYPAARLVVLYATVTLAIFAVFPLQLGPRHRYQLVFVTAWAQIHTLWHAAILLGRQRATPTAGGLTAPPPL